MVSSPRAAKALEPDSFRPAPARKKDRVRGRFYLLKGRQVVWSGKQWHCEHDRRREQCIECGGASICKHGRRRNYCRPCGGSSFCKHNRRKNYCRPCGGSSFCEHSRERNKCRDCGGASICEHRRERNQCRECLDMDKLLASNLFCVTCADKWLSASRRDRGITVCATCDEETPERREHQVRRLLDASWQRQFGEPAPMPSIEDDQLLAGRALRFRPPPAPRPRLRLDGPHCPLGN